MIKQKVLITGGAGFIGFHTARFLAKQSVKILLLDNINNYYSPDLKIDRLCDLGFDKNELHKQNVTDSKKYSNLQFVKCDISNVDELDLVFAQNDISVIINLAAQAGVRYSIENPAEYLKSNISGFFNILEAARKYEVKKIIYAGSSSVYGNNSVSPFSEKECINQPESFYAATKAANELMAHSYAKIYGINFIGLRFFTVYGAWGRPDMAYYKFTDKILKGEAIQIYNKGQLYRDFTYIDDVVKSIFLLLQKFQKMPQKKFFNEIFNIGGGQKVKLDKFIQVLEEKIGIKAVKNYADMQKGDVYETNADASKLEEYINYKPTVTIEAGLAKFVEWYKKYYNKNV